MAELVKIPLASAEYQARFERPILVSLALTGREPLRLSLPHYCLLISVWRIRKLSRQEHQPIIRRFLEFQNAGFAFNSEQRNTGSTKSASSWTTADEDGQILLAAEHALMEGSGAKVASCMVTVAMHLQPLS